MTAKTMLRIDIAVMTVIVVTAIVVPRRFVGWLVVPNGYLHVKLAHILSVTLFFANVVIGTLWESRSLRSGRPEIVRHTYETVAWMDAFFTAPLIIVAVLSGLSLGTMLGGVFAMGWLVVSLAIFVLSGMVWLALDIPSQYRVKRLFAAQGPDATAIDAELLRVLRFRRTLNIATIVPLFVVFALMVHKPEFAIWGYFHRP